MKIIIVGGVAGGASFAARMRRLDENAEIIMFEKGKYISFANCGLPYYIGKKIEDRDSLILQNIEVFEKKFNMKVYNNTEVTKIDKENKYIEYKTKNNFISKEYYDFLILSPGATPVKPNINGIEDAENVFTLRNIPDTDKIKEYIEKNDIKNATVIGGGFIGLEMTENLKNLGLNTTLIEMGPQVMSTLDFEMAQELHMELEDNGINLILNNGVSKFENKGKILELTDGKKINTDITILSIGVYPENMLAKECGLKIGERGGIVVDNNMRTSDSYIYAIGDAVEVNHFISDKKTQIPLAGPANYQGRMVADIIYGLEESYKGSLGTSIAKVFNLQVASTGLNEKSLSVKYNVIHLHPVNHAVYYPNSYPMHLKIIFNDEERILGAQCVAIEGADKVIDVISTAIYANLKVTELKNLQFAYAPPFNSAKTAINFIGYVSENVLTNKVKFIQYSEIESYQNKGYKFIDVSEKEEFNIGHIKNSLNIPLASIREHINELKNGKFVLYCRVSLRAYNAYRILKQHNIEAVVLDGGYKTYQMANYILKGSKEIFTSETKLINSSKDINKASSSIKINACGLQCPGPITKVFNAINTINEGDSLEVTVTDIGFTKDISSWCQTTGNTLYGIEENDGKYTATIIKGTSNINNKDNKIIETNDSATIIVFSGDLDKVMAAFIIATGAASMGKKVTMFFTFWGLSVIKKKANVNKDIMEKMFDTMLPDNASKLGLSKMNMAGIGSKIMKKIMKEKNVDDLPTLINNARELGVKFIACSMSMDVMGIKKEELIEDVEIGGVATYLGDAEKSGINLFI